MSESTVYDDATESTFNTSAGEKIRVPRLTARAALQVTALVSDMAGETVDDQGNFLIYTDAMLDVIDKTMAIPIEGYPKGRNIDQIFEITRDDILPLANHILTVEGLYEAQPESKNAGSPGTPPA